MSRRTNFLHFRASDDLVEQLNALAAQSPNNNRSQIIRALLYEALGDEAGKAAVLQAVFDAAGLQKLIFRKLTIQMQEQLPMIIDEALAEANAE